MNQKVVFFDLDGTLIDSAPGIAAGLQKAFDVCGVEYDFTQFSSLIGPPIHIILKRHFAHLGSELHEKIVQEFRRAYDDVAWVNYTEYGPLATLLSSIEKCGAEYYLVTNKKFGVTLKIMRQILADFSEDRILAPAHPKYPYPDKCGALRNFLALKSDPWNHKIFVGDTEEDQTVAHATECSFIAAQYGYGVFQDLSRSYAASNFEHMSSTVMNLLASTMTIQHGSSHESY